MGIAVRDAKPASRPTRRRRDAGLRHRLAAQRRQDRRGRPGNKGTSLMGIRTIIMRTTESAAGRSRIRNRTVGRTKSRLLPHVNAGLLPHRWPSASVGKGRRTRATRLLPSVFVLSLLPSVHAVGETLGDARVGSIVVLFVVGLAVEAHDNDRAVLWKVRVKHAVSQRHALIVPVRAKSRPKARADAKPERVRVFFGKVSRLLQMRDAGAGWGH